MYTIALVFGTRPEILKFIPLLYELKKSEHIQVLTIFTGQHDELAKELLAEFSITPDHQFSVMEKEQSIANLSSKLFARLDKTFNTIQPHLIFSQGDTTTALITAQVAFYQRINFAHLEAGLRTNDVTSPFPEEFNRRVISLVSTFHFCPTMIAKKNLQNEGITNNVFVTGNTIIDLIYKTVKARKNKELLPQKKILITCHRRENFGLPLINICNAIKQLALRYPDHRFILPVHPNPKAYSVITKQLSGKKNIVLTPPLTYQTLIDTLLACKLVLTDSGGLQEEAPALNKPVLVLRTNTERPEGIKTGAAKLIGTSTDAIVSETIKLLEDKSAYDKMANALCPYGDGMAAKKISSIVLEYLQSQQDVTV